MADKLTQCLCSPSHCDYILVGSRSDDDENFSLVRSLACWKQVKCLYTCIIVALDPATQPVRYVYMMNMFTLNFCVYQLDFI